MAWDVLSGAAKMAWDVLCGVTKTAWDVLSGVAKRYGMFCLGCQKTAWDVLSRDVLSYIRKYQCVKKIPARKFGPSGWKYGNFSSYVGLGPATTPKKYQEFHVPQKIFEILATQKNRKCYRYKPVSLDYNSRGTVPYL